MSGIEQQGACHNFEWTFEVRYTTTANIDSVLSKRLIKNVCTETTIIKYKQTTGVLLPYYGVFG